MKVFANYAMEAFNLKKSDVRAYYQIDQLWQNMPKVDFRVAP